MPSFSNLTISNATADQDRGAALLLVTRENERRAAMTPPGTPLATAPNAALLASYISVIQEVVLPGAHSSWIKEAAEKQIGDLDIRARWEAATDAQRAAALSVLPPAP